MSRLVWVIVGVACCLVAVASPTVLSGRELDLRWPQLLGKTVHVRMVLVRALDVTRYHGKVDASDVVVVVPPGKAWTDKREVCATVLGRDSLSQRGRTTVVGLLWTPCRGATP